MNKSLKLFNSLSKEKEVFYTNKKGNVSMYVCGPTVYNLLHIGNFRGPIFFNLVRNWLEHLKYKVKYVYNYTVPVHYNIVYFFCSTVRMLM